MNPRIAACHRAPSRLAVPVECCSRAPSCIRLCVKVLSAFQNPSPYAYYAVAALSLSNIVPYAYPHSFFSPPLRVPLMKRKLHESPGSQLSHAASRIAPLCCKGACPRALGPLHHGEYSVGVVTDSVYITLQRYAVWYDVLLTCGFAVYALCRWRRGVCCVYIVACSHAGSSRC